MMQIEAILSIYLSLFVPQQTIQHIKEKNSETGRTISQLTNLCTGIRRICMWVRSVSRCYRPWNSRKI